MRIELFVVFLVCRMYKLNLLLARFFVGFDLIFLIEGHKELNDVSLVNPLKKSF